jgi:hypothetical protein
MFPFLPCVLSALPVARAPQLVLLGVECCSRGLPTLETCLSLPSLLALSPLPALAATFFFVSFFTFFEVINKSI